MSYTKECTSCTQFINEFPDAYEQFIATVELSPDDPDFDINDFEDLKSLIAECGDWSDEDAISSNSYRKDHCICDAEYSEAIYIIDLHAKKITDERFELEELAKNTQKWRDFFELLSPWEIEEHLLKYKFPEKL